MRVSLIRARSLRLPVVLAVMLGLLMQLLPPPAAAFAGPADRLLAAGSICHAGGGDGDPAPLPADHGDCDHCILCQVTPLALLPPIPAPGLPGLAFAPHAPSVRGDAKPAGSIARAYASRAPPTIG